MSNDFTDFDRDRYAEKGLYVPPIGNAAEQDCWEFVAGKLKEKGCVLWLEKIELSVFKTSDLALPTGDQIPSLAWVRRADGDKDKIVGYEPGDVIVMPAHAMKEGFELPHSKGKAFAELYANKGIQIVDAANVLYRIPKAACKANHEAFMAKRAADKKAVADTQAEIAGKNAPEGE